MKRLKAMVALLVVAMTGCYATYPPYYYDYVYYDPFWYGCDGYYYYSWYDPYGVYYFSDPATDLDVIAAAIADQAGSYFTPAGCAVATASGSTVNYTFNRCRGGFGLDSISGAVRLELSKSNGQLAFTATSTDLTMDGHPYVLDLHATATSSGTQRAVTIRSRSRAPELVDSREAEFTMYWEQGSGCVTMNGEGGSRRDDMSTTSTITGYQRCVNQCPSAGKVKVNSASGTFITEFDGSSTVKVTAPDGRTQSYELQCQ